MATEINKVAELPVNQRDKTREILRKSLAVSETSPRMREATRSYEMGTALGSGISKTASEPSPNLNFNYTKGLTRPIQEELLTHAGGTSELPPVSKVTRVKRRIMVEEATTFEVKTLLEEMGEEMAQQLGGRYNLVDYTTVSDQTYNVIFQHATNTASMQLSCAIDLFEGVSSASLTTGSTSENYTQIITRKYNTAVDLVQGISSLLEAAEKA